jgi:hypothetical protein
MPVIHFITFGILFFLISFIINAQFSISFLVTIIKYFIFITMMSTVLKDVKGEEVYSLLLLGCLSVIYEAVLVTNPGDTSSGFYLNANFAACASIIGYAFSLTITNKKLKTIGQILFTISGFVTFSIIFLFLWILINLLSVFANTRSIYKLVVYLCLLVVFISFADKLHLSKHRLSSLPGVSGKKIDDKLKAGRPSETWALYYDKILKNPIWGNGYGQTVGEADIRFTIQVGVYNTFLMIMGQAGVFALLYFLWIYGYITMNGLHFFKRNPNVFFLSLALILYLLTSHDYFDNYLVLFTSLWLYHEIYKMKKTSWRNPRVIIMPSGKIKEPSEENLLRQYHLN